MHIQRLEDIQAWRLARELTQLVYDLTKKPGFSKDFGLQDQIRSAAGSSMHNIAEGFDADSTAEFMRFLRYAKRSCTEVQSELYVALDQKYLSQDEFKKAYQLSARTRSAIGGFIAYLKRYQQQIAVKPKG